MKILIYTLIGGMYLSASAQEIRWRKNSPQPFEATNTTLTILSELHSNPDIEANNPLPNMTWLQNFSTLLAQNIAYPARGRAYQITGKMYVKFGIDTKGNIHIVGFEQSLGADFDQAVKDALLKIPHSKIPHPVLPLAGLIHFYLPVYFKS